MFETIGTLFTIAFWAVAIFLFLGGIILCIGNLISGNGFAKFVSIIAIMIGIYVFFRMYDWTESIAWCLMATGMVLCFVRVPAPGEENTAPQKEKKYGLGDAIVDTYCEYELTKAAVKDAIRESKE